MKNSIPHIFHINLRDQIPNEEYWLYAGGKKINLKTHTPASIAAAKADNAQLQAIPDENMTHYTESVVSLPDSRAVMLSVRYSTKNTPAVPNHYGIHHLLMYVPSVNAIKIEDTTQAKSMKTDDGYEYEYYLEHGYIDYSSTAQALISCHPDLFVFDAETAQVIQEHLGTNPNDPNYAAVKVLSDFIAAKGMPTQNAGEGWAYWKPFDASDAIEAGNIASPPDGMETYYSLTFDSEFNQNAGPGLSAVLNSTKNDLRLQDKKWSFEPGMSVRNLSNTEVSSKKSGLTDLGTTAAKVVTNDDNWHVLIASEHKANGLASTVEMTDSESGKVTLTMKNTYVRWLAVYVRFYDADGNVIELGDDWRSDDITSEINESLNGMDLQSDSLRFLGTLEPVDTAEGIPIQSNPGSGEFTFSFPDDAVQARFYGCGLGSGGTDTPACGVIGGGFTAFSNLAIPAVLMIATANSMRSKEIYDKMGEIGDIMDFITVMRDTIQLFEGAFNLEVAWDAVEDIARLIFDKTAVWALEWVAAQIGEAAAEDAIPGVGWIIAMNNVLVDVALISQTCTEVATSPLMIENKLSVVIDTNINVYPDPRAIAFPPHLANEERYCKIKIQRKGDSTAIVLSQAIGEEQTIANYNYSNQLGGQVKFEATFYCGDQITAHTSTGYMENDRETMDNVALYLVEIPIPIQSDSVYNHAAILTSQDEVYQWKESSVAPSSTKDNLNTSPSGNAISDWMGLALNQKNGMIGLSWKGANSGLSPADSNNTSYVEQQLYVFQNINIPGVPMNDVQFPSAGFLGEAKLVYDVFPAKYKMKTVNGEQVWDLDKDGNLQADDSVADLGSYYIDPSKSQQSQTEDGGYHLRKVSLQRPVPAYDMSETQNSWGRFPYFPDSITMHPLGYVIGINQEFHKLMVLALPEQMGTGTSDTQANMARVYGGQAQDYDNNGGRPGLLFLHAGLTCTYDGTIIVLEQVGDSIARLQAFDVNGNPVYIFNASEDANNLDSDSVQDGKSPFFMLPTGVRYSDVVAIGDAKCSYIYLLSYENNGGNQEDYKVSIYQCGENAPAGNLIVENSGISAAKINVDMWHTLYTLNYESTKTGTGANAEPAEGRTVPSVSEWLIVNPTS